MHNMGPLTVLHALSIVSVLICKEITTVDPVIGLWKPVKISIKIKKIKENKLYITYFTQNTDKSQTKSKTFL